MEPAPRGPTPRGKLKWNPTKEMEMKFLLWMELKGGWGWFLSLGVKGCCCSRAPQRKETSTNKPNHPPYYGMEAKKKDKREWEWELAFFGWNGK